VAFGNAAALELVAEKPGALPAAVGPLPKARSGPLLSRAAADPGALKTMPTVGEGAPFAAASKPS
jgi:hypothetical protein